MVSFTLETVKFLLIYRHLQNIYWFKREVVLLYVPLPEALAIAYFGCTDNVRAHADMNHRSITQSRRHLSKTIKPIWRFRIRFALLLGDLYKQSYCARKGTIRAYKVSTGVK